MGKDTQVHKAQAFREMHNRSGVLLLPNAWDAVTARVFARVSTATRFATLALSAVENAAKELRRSGRFECLGAELTHPEVQRLFA